MSKKVIRSECLNVTYLRSKNDPASDLSIVAEYNWYDDGSEGPDTRFIKNYERPFWVVKKALRKYNDKHITEQLDNCERFSSTSANLAAACQQRLGQRVDARKSLNMVCRSPYIYGTDVTTPTILKKKYKVKFPEAVGKGERYIAALDVETNMLGGEEHIISIGLTLRDKHYLFIWSPFLDGVSNAEAKLQAAYQKYMGDFEAVDKKTGKVYSRNLIEERNSRLITKFCRSPGECVIECYKVAHELNIDFMSIFNMKFDINKMLDALRDCAVDPEEVFSHPTVPNEFRSFKFIEDKIRKETSTGKSMNKHYATLWHRVECASRFYHICPMSVYKNSRVTKADLIDYKLDTILETELGMRKLKFKEADHLEKAAWHQFMQENYPVEYLIYNIFDCVGLELLDEKTKDISHGIVFSTDCSEYSRWGSGPKKLSDALHFFALERGQVLGSTSDQMREKYDNYVPTMNNWIAMLQSNNMIADGLSIFHDAPHIKTRCYANNFDTDVSAAYPTGEDEWNVGRETSRMELCKVKDRDERIMRKTGVDLTAPRTNALEITYNMFKGPTLIEMRNKYLPPLGPIDHSDLDVAI